MKALKSYEENGFTLAEILVVITITAVVGTIMTVIFINTLRGSNKAKIVANIKQNGQAVLENMDKIIRGADNVVCVKEFVDNGDSQEGTPETVSTGNALVIYSSGVYTRFRLRFSEKDITNSSITQDIFEPGTDETPDQVKNRICIAPLQQNLQVLTDDNLQTGVSVKELSFKLNEQAGSRETVTIEFKLAPAEDLPATVRDQIDPVPFQTTVQLR